MDTKNIPKWLKRYIDETGLNKIKQSVAKAETQTSGEIVPMVVLSSSTTGHVPVILFCCLWISYFLFEGHHLMELLFGMHYTPYFDLTLMIPFALISTALGAVPFIQRSLVSPEDRQLQVDQRSQVEFYQAKLNETDGSSGILIFISMMEHRVVVLADKAISAKLPPETWDGLVNTTLGSLRNKDLATGLCQAIEICGNLLTPHLPIQADDKNELQDHLIIKE